MTRLKSLLRRFGVYGGRLSRRPFGEDILHDIDRLSQSWGTQVRTILDVGANIGQTAERFADHFPDAKIWSFEPHPTTFATLQQTVSGRPNVQTRNLALGDTNEMVAFFEYENPLINSRIADAAYPRRKGLTPRRLQVEQQTVDSFCAAEGIAEIDFLKVDTEGFDRAVIAGATGLLASGAIRFVQCEFALSSEGKATTVADLLPLIEPYGYYLLSTYLDFVVLDGKMFANGNVLFVRPNE
ncbi:FkbM family methyltransferase [Phenylobacterium sp.]|uniref:FkbM family methyltransferase n=1 Tax=Phenylobacterium sp. TaxID=1871053 RepID=UPI002731460D|nr:FkbM family methyltransferase [Phenylobacterium sp.]MDP1598231.1 FkbM family methyltransferase [Phenylobacterium sp.]MDP3594705.1 FkbM family methyltransferase [Phenylobacterium sp.]